MIGNILWSVKSHLSSDPAKNAHFYCMAICNISQFSKCRQNECGIKLLYSRIPWINPWTGKIVEGMACSLACWSPSEPIWFWSVEFLYLAYLFYLMTMLYLSWQRLAEMASCYIRLLCVCHYCDVTMAAIMRAQPVMRAQIKENIKVPRQWPLRGKFTVNSPHNWPVTRKMFACDDVFMYGRIFITDTKRSQP